MQSALDNAELAARVRAAQAGDTDALAQLLQYGLYIILATVKSRVPEDDVEDVLQEVLLAIWEALPSLRNPGSFSAWLHTITRREIADYHQSRDLTGVVSSAEISGVALGEQDAIEKAEERVDVEATWAHLSRREQLLLELRVENGLPFAEVGCRIGISEGAAKMQFQRTKLKFFADRAVSVTFWVEIGTYLMLVGRCPAAQ